MSDDIRYDLGGQGHGVERKTVNLYGVADIHKDITDLDAFCGDGTVAEFFLSHTMEHVPGELYVAFLRGLVRKLRQGGELRIVQTDADVVMRDYVRGNLCFRSMRSVIFTPPDRLTGDRVDANPLQCHRNMWSAREMARDLEAVGLEASTFDPGTWAFDMSDPFYPDELKRDWGKPIGQLGVLGVKP